MLALLSEESPDGFVEFTLYFEDWRKAQETKEQHIEERKKRQIENEREIIEKFLIEECDIEGQTMLAA